jgi:hypothetical protein
VKLQMFIVPVLAAAGLASGCASWDAHDRGNDYQCGYSGLTENHGPFAHRQDGFGCGAEYAAAAVGQETVEYTSEPVRSGWQRFEADILSQLPLDREL